MNPWYLVVLGLAVVVGAAALYGLHRLCLWLEARGHLYYVNKQPESSAAGCFVAFQQVIEPPTKHVLHVKHEKRARSEDEGAGPPAEADR